MQISWYSAQGKRKARKTSSRRLSNEGYTTSHRLKWNPLRPDGVGRIEQHARKGETADKYEHMYSVQILKKTPVLFDVDLSNEIDFIEDMEILLNPSSGYFLYLLTLPQ